MRSRSTSGRGRSGVPYTLFFAVIVMAVAAVAVAALVWPEPEGANTTQVTTDSACDAQPTREVCYSVEVDGAEYRYSVVSSFGGAGEDTQEIVPAVIYDPGGPGMSILSGDFNLGAVQSAISGNYALVAIEEPWVTATVSEQCKEASTRFYRAVVEPDPDAMRDAGTSVWQDCDLSSGSFGFSAEEYSQVVSAILERHSLRLEGFVGHSFASTRLHYLEAGSGAAPDWATIMRPFPIGATADELAAARLTAVEHQVGELDNEARFADGIESEGRSIPVTVADYWSALVELGYLSEEARPEAIEALADANSAAGVAGELSDGLWGRYGVDSISPGMLAQWTEVCQAAGSLTSSADSGVSYVLASMFAPCAGSEQEVFREDFSSDLCVTTADGDTVTPALLVDQYLESAEIVRVEAASHADTNGLSTCLEYLAID